ncbi:MAG: sulfatase [Myxococcota bacterium]|nr:sulfatase [Myxococcota bacterium]
MIAEATSPQPNRVATRGWGSRVVGVVLVAGLLRGLLAFWVFPVTPMGDELYYAETAARMARGEGHVYGPHGMRARWPPGQAALLAPFMDTEEIAEHPELLAELSRRQPEEMEAHHRAFLAPLVAVEVVAGVVVVAAAAALGWALFGGRAAFFAALLATVHPALLAASHYLWSETLFTALLSGSLALGVAWMRRPHWGVAVLAGVGFGLAGLTRELALPVAGALGLWWVATSTDRTRAALHAALLGLATLFTVAPWTVRNHVELDRLVPVSTVGWMGLREGNTLADDAWFERDWPAVREFRRRYVSIPDEGERMDVSRAEALALIGEAQPAWLLRKLVLNLGELSSPVDDALSKLRQGAYGSVPAAAIRGVLVVTWAFTLFAVFAAALGAAAAPGTARRTLPLFILAPLVLVHVVANAFPKYRLPFEPLLLAYAGFACTAGLGALRAGWSRRSLSVALVLLALFAVLGTLRFGPRALRIWEAPVPASVPEVTEASALRPARIVLLSVDTARDDRIDAETAPAIARLAAEGARAERFYAASNYTLPSHMSIFTGLDPQEHGVTRDAARLAPGVPTLAELLAASGYRTRAFHEGAYVEARFGFARGFEAYRRHPHVDVVRDALPDVLDWIRDQDDAPWFLFLHTYAAHFPYGGFARYRSEAPERALPPDGVIDDLRRRYPGERLYGPARRDALPADERYLCSLYNQLAEAHGTLLPCGSDVLDEAFRAAPEAEGDLAAIVRSYDARIGEVDEAVARIRETLESLGQWEDTLFVITADHGESFYEHGLPKHEYVPFDEVLRVPLVISWPEFFGERGGVLVAGPAWHLDLLPTLLSLAGISPPEGLAGKDLSPVLAGEAALPADRSVFPAILRPAHKEQRPLRRVAIQGDSKRIEGHAVFGDEAGFLFDLAADPGERHNLRTLRPGEVAALDAAIASWEAGLSPRAPIHQGTGLPITGEADPVEIAPDLREGLRQLGYVE